MQIITVLRPWSGHEFLAGDLNTLFGILGFNCFQSSMMHPEMQEGPIGALMRSMTNAETVTVECQCGAEVQMNKAYSKYVTGKLSSCRFCRNEQSE